MARRHDRKESVITGTMLSNIKINKVKEHFTGEKGSVYVAIDFMQSPMLLGPPRTFDNPNAHFIFLLYLLVWPSRTSRDALPTENQNASTVPIRCRSDLLPGTVPVAGRY